MIVSKDPWTPISAEQWDALRAAWPDGARLEAAWSLAMTVDVLADLLAGRPVDRDRLRADALARAEQNRLVVLRRPIDLFGVREEA